MAKLQVEKVGGFAGFGGANLRSHGEIDSATLSAADQAAVEGLFQSGGKKGGPVHGFRYRITRGSDTIEVAEDAVPAAVSQCVKDELE